jgi:hypothetical protein
MLTTRDLSFYSNNVSGTIVVFWSDSVGMGRFGFLLPFPLPLPLSSHLTLLAVLISLIVFLHLTATQAPRRLEELEREENTRRKAERGESGSEERGPRRYSAANSKVKKYGQQQGKDERAKANVFAL